MAITKIEIIPIEIKLKEPFVISLGALYFAKNTIVKIYDAEGNFGTGECCPYRSIHGETQDGTVAAGKLIAKSFIGKDESAIAVLTQSMNKVITGNKSIKCAFDMALYDLNAKKSGVPLYKFLLGENTKKIFTDMTVSLLPCEMMVEKALKYVNDGFPVLKLKLGECPSTHDVERVKSIRKAIGEHIPLRLDANQGWNLHEANRALKAMEEYDIEHCEEPLPCWNYRDLVTLRNNSPIPLMADESMFNHHDAMQLLSLNAVDMFNIKLGKSGGIYNATKIAGMAEAAGVYCQVGSFSESRLGISALVHFSLVWDNIKFYDLDSPLMLSEDPVIGGMIYQKDWQVTVDDTPGIGAEFDPKWLKKFPIIEILND